MFFLFLVFMSLGIIQVKLPSAGVEGNQFKIRVSYSTTSGSTALEWLSPEQTAGKQHPFLFSQCEAIHCRSMIPCQDSPSVKATYSAEMKAPSALTVLMSGIREGEPEPVDGGLAVTRWKQEVPIQSYLIAIAVGALESRKIGPRSQVWAEASVVDQSAFDFSETETMLQKAEELCGPYVWGIYDVLVLPPSFPFGGMENPCLTFATPTLLSGDKSNADVIAHEIAHSWTGNLVTNVNFEHFWLNEGFTVFTERKIVGRMHGEPARHFSAILGWKDLQVGGSSLGVCLNDLLAIQETVEVVMGPTNPFTALVPRLAGADPDDAFSVCRHLGLRGLFPYLVFTRWCPMKRALPSCGTWRILSEGQMSLSPSSNPTTTTLPTSRSTRISSRLSSWRSSLVWRL